MPKKTVVQWGDWVVHSPWQGLQRPTHPFLPFFLSECNFGSKYVAFLVWALEDSEGTDQNEATSIQIDLCNHPLQLTAVKRGVHILLHLLLNESNASWFLSNLLSFLPLPGYSDVVEERREGGHVKEWAAHLYDPRDWLYGFPSPSFERNTEKKKKKQWNINRAALGGLGEGWRDRRPRGGFSHTLLGLKPYTLVPL